MSSLPETSTAPLSSIPRPAEQPTLPQPADEPPPDNLRVIRVALVILAVIAVVGSITYLREILPELLIALFLYYAINPAAQILIRRRVPTWLAYVLLLAIAVVLAILLGQMLYSNALQFKKQLEEHRYEEKFDALISRLGPANAKKIGGMIEDATNHLFQWALGTTLGLFEAGVLVFFYLLFIILNSQKIQHRIQRAFAPQRAEHLLLIGRKINEGMQDYVKTKTNVSLGLAGSCTLIMYLFGLDYYLLWGAFFFALNYVTYVGSLAACVPPIALAFLQLNPVAAVFLTVLLIVNRLFWIDYIEIKASGQKLNVDPLLLLLSIAYWGTFWGPVGLVLAVPMLTSLKIVLANIDQTKHWAVLLGED